MDKLDAKIDWKVPIEQSVLINPNIDNASLRLYLILLSYARNKITAFPSRETLAEGMNCTVRNIDLIKNKLKKLGLLTWESKYNGSNKYNVYTLLQYQPIQKNNKPAMEQKIARPTSKKLLPNNKQYNNTTSRYFEVIEEFKKQYKNFVQEETTDVKDLISEGWINNPEYVPSKGDYRNLEQYFSQYGESGLEKLKICFKFLPQYLEEEIKFGQFYTSRGMEMTPTISLFVKAKYQHDKLMRFTKENLEYEMKKE
ncbi:MAG: helix-turn-helix domain-containing protein [bacterium]